MNDEILTSTIMIEASAQAVFAVLTDPASHAAIDGTGWVCAPVDDARLARAGQIFRVAMFHEKHPDGRYEMANRVQVFEPARAISWEPGQDVAGGEPWFGGWIWRYDLTAASPHQTEVRLSYDWSAVPPPVREEIQFPAVDVDHLHNSLQHLAALAES